MSIGLGIGRSWGASISRGHVLAIADEHDLTRIGHCWAQGVAKTGDLLLCLRHSGDWFHDFILLSPVSFEEGSLVARGNPRELGAYELSTIVGRVSEEAIEAFCRGEEASIAIDQPLPGALIARVELQEIGSQCADARAPSRPKRPL